MSTGMILGIVGGVFVGLYILVAGTSFFMERKEKNRVKKSAETRSAIEKKVNEYDAKLKTFDYPETDADAILYNKYRAEIGSLLRDGQRTLDKIVDLNNKIDKPYVSLVNRFNI